MEETNREISTQVDSWLPERRAEYRELIENIIAFDVAKGKAKADTLKGYARIMSEWVEWCRQHRLDPSLATTQDAFAYRYYIVNEVMHKAKTVELKLTVIRQFYNGLIRRGHMPISDGRPALNPFHDCKAPADEDAGVSRIKYLNAGEAELLKRELPKGDSLRALRDRAIINLMLIQGLRRVEVHRANDEDYMPGQHGRDFLVRGKGRKRIVFPREETERILDQYLERRGPVHKDTAVDSQNELTPMFVAIGRDGSILGRISRRGLNRIVDKYLAKAAVKKKRSSCHALRHTSGTMMYRATKDIKKTADHLGHLSLRTAEIYVHEDQSGRERLSNNIPISLED